MSRITLHGKIGQHEVAASNFVLTEPGRVTLEFANGSAEFAYRADEHLELILWNEDNVKIVDGTWTVRKCEKTAHGQRLNLQRSDLVFVPHLERTLASLSAQAILHSSRLRAFNLRDPENEASIAALIAEVKHAPMAIGCSIASQLATYQATLNFAADRREMTSLDLQLDTPANFTSLVASHSAEALYTVQFTWLGCKYIFCTTIESFDADFNLASVAMPEAILAYVARRFARLECSVPMVLSTTKAQLDVQLVVITPTAGEITTTGSFADLEPVFQLATRDCVTKVEGTVLHTRGSQLAFVFAKQADPHAIRNLINVVAADNCLVRDNDHTEPFFDLYKDLGYKPKDPALSDSWRAQSLAAWELEDRLFPGNTIGYPKADSIDAAISVLPISPTAVCGHSTAIRKTVHGIGGYLLQAQLNLTWAMSEPGIKYYLSSIRIRSRFASRLHMCFEMLPHPATAQILPAMVVAKPAAQITQQAADQFRFESVDCKTLRSAVPEVARTFFDNVATPHQALAHCHTVQTGRVRLNGSQEPLACFYMAHDAPHYMTAIDLYCCIMILVVAPPTYDLATLAAQAREQLGFPNHEVDIICLSSDWLAQLRDGKNEEIFYYQFHEDDLGPVFASISRAVYSVLRKYGDEGLEYLRRTV